MLLSWNFCTNTKEVTCLHLALSYPSFSICI